MRDSLHLSFAALISAWAFAIVTPVIAIPTPLPAPAPAAQFTASASPQTLTQGDTLTIPISVTPQNGAALARVSLGLAFNPAWQQYLAADNAGSAFGVVANEAVSTGNATYSCAVVDLRSTAGVTTGPALMAKLTFKTLVAGTYSADLSVGPCASFDGAWAADGTVIASSYGAPASFVVNPAPSPVAAAILASSSSPTSPSASLSPSPQASPKPTTAPSRSLAGITVQTPAPAPNTALIAPPAVVSRAIRTAAAHTQSLGAKLTVGLVAIIILLLVWPSKLQDRLLGHLRRHPGKPTVG